MIRFGFALFLATIAVILYWRRPFAYVGYTMWIWFLIPLVRRLVDWKLGWANPNYILLAPLFVSAVSVLTLIAPSRRRPLRMVPTFALCGMAILYGFVMGLFQHPSLETVYGLFNWSAPILFALFLALSSADYPRLRRVLEWNLTAGVAFMGAYGIFQFFTAPRWDTFWLENISAGLIDPSFGQPHPFKIRVWSTLNAPGPFANAMMAALLILLVTRIRFKVPASALGYVSFLLSMVRSAWLTFLIGLLLLMRSEKPSRILKLLATFAVLGALLIPVVQSPDIAPVLSSRLKSFTELHRDESYRARQHMYQVVFAIIREEPFGHGLLNTEIDRNLVVDSGLLIMLLQLGWMGSALYFMGLLAFLLRPQRRGSVPLNISAGQRAAPLQAAAGAPAPEKPVPVEPLPLEPLPVEPPPMEPLLMEEDRLPLAARAAVFAYLTQLASGAVFEGVTGTLFWICIGTALSADHWQRMQGRAAEPELPAWRRLRRGKA